MAAAICHQRSHRLQTVSDTSGRLISTPTFLMGACDDDCRCGLAVQESLESRVTNIQSIGRAGIQTTARASNHHFDGQARRCYSSSTLPWGWDQPFNTFSTFTGHSYSSIANYPFRYGDDPDWPIPPRHTQDENCPLQPCCHLRHCILRPTTLASQHGDDCCCADCLGSSITRQPIASTQCGSTSDQTIECRTHIHLQTGGPESNPHSVNMGSVESETITQKADSTTQAQGNPPPAKKKKHSRTVKTHQAKAERTYKYHCDQPDCPYQINWSADLERHKKTHQAKAERTYKYHCDQPDCPYQTDRSANLKRHKKTHQAKAERTYKYHCDQPDCPYQTDWSADLEQHKKTHQAKAERTYKYHCDQPECPYQTDRSVDLERHKKTHQAKAERTYKYHCDQPDCPYQTDLERRSGAA